MLLEVLSLFEGKRVAVVVPAYFEEKLIADTLVGMPALVDAVHVVDDGSTDRTSAEARAVAGRDGRVKVHRHEVNQGVGGAILTGFRAALEDRAEILVVMAGDNQMDPAYLPALLRPVADGRADFTKGNRLGKGLSKGMGAWRLTGNVLLTLLTKIASGYWWMRDPQNGYVAITADALRAVDMDKLRRGYEFENDLMVAANIRRLRLRNVDIPARYGNEVSGIRYGRFIVRTSAYLFTSFVRRVWKRYVVRGNPLGLLYLAGLAGTMAIPALLLLGQWAWIAFGPLAFLVACLVEAASSRPRGGTAS